MAELSIHYSGPIVSRNGALKVGLKRYFTGIPCKFGHIAQTIIGSGDKCVVCALIRSRNWKKANPHKRTEYYERTQKPKQQSLDEAARREFNAHKAKLERARRANNPEKQKERELARRAQRLALREFDAGRARPATCDLCKGSGIAGKGDIVWDHCHKHGHFRGWLCDRCNKVLGLVKDSPVLLRKMAKYIEQSDDKAEREKAAVFALHGLFSR